MIAEKKSRALITEQELDKQVIVSGGKKDVGPRDLALVEDAMEEAKRAVGSIVLDVEALEQLNNAMQNDDDVASNDMIPIEDSDSSVEGHMVPTNTKGKRAADVEVNRVRNSVAVATKTKNLNGVDFSAEQSAELDRQKEEMAKAYDAETR